MKTPDPFCFDIFSFLPHQGTCMKIQFVQSAPTPASSMTSYTTCGTLKKALKSHGITPQQNSISFWSWVYHQPGTTIIWIPEEDSTEVKTWLLNSWLQWPVTFALSKILHKHIKPWHTSVDKYHVKFWAKIKYNAQPQSVFGWRSETLCCWLLPGALYRPG